MSGGPVDFQGLKTAVLTHALVLYARHFPGGRKQGQEWVCGSIKGGPGDSFKISLRNGAYCDFADPQIRGGDLVAALAQKHDITQLESAKRLASEIGFELYTPAAPIPQDITMPPVGERPPNMYFKKYSMTPKMHWTYRNEKDEVLFYIARYEPLGEKKQIVPWCWSSSSNRYIAKHWPVPRPLYGLELLKPDAPICIVEGEKAADAARELVTKERIVLTWPGGSAAVRQVDWSPIYGREVLLWADADEAGMKAMNEIAALLHENGCKVKILDPTGQPDKWDAADALNQGWDNSRFKEWARPRIHQYLSATEVLPAEITTDTEEEATPSLRALWTDLGLILNSTGSVVLNIDNVVRALESHKNLKDMVWYDEFHCRFFTKNSKNEPIPWADKNSLELTLYFQRHLGFQKLTRNIIEEAISIVGHRNLKNEPKDYMKSLVWDQIPRVDNFFTQAAGSLDNEYTRAISHNFWVSLIARVFSPGCQVDEMIILEGAQGTYKSTLLKIIGDPWYAQASARPGEKDFYQGLHGKILLEIAEMASFKKSEIEIIKKDITCRVDDIRVVYARYGQKYPRTCIFAGTTNDNHYLTDPTGGRRFMPIEISKIDLEYVKKFRDQFFAEAVHLYQAGDSWHEFPAEAAKAQQESRRQHDEWESIIASNIQGKPEATLKEIALQALGIDAVHLDMHVQKRIGRILTALNWYQKPARRNGILSKVWFPKPNGNGSGNGHHEEEPKIPEFFTVSNTKSYEEAERDAIEGKVH